MAVFNSYVKLPEGTMFAYLKSSAQFLLSYSTLCARPHFALRFGGTSPS